MGRREYICMFLATAAFAAGATSAAARQPDYSVEDEHAQGKPDEERAASIAAAATAPGQVVPPKQLAQAQLQRSNAPSPPEQAAQAAKSSGAIVVTGSRLRREAVQDVPLAVSVMNQRTIEALHATDIRALSALAPNLNIIAHAANQGVPIIFLRGFGAVGTSVDVEPAVAIYVDEVYNSTNLGALSDLFDIERIEVLRGPQSTLFGKNASAGAILVYRTRPRIDHFTGKAAVEYGSFNLMQFQTLLTGPVIKDVLGVKVYVNVRRSDGWARNVVLPGVKMGGDKRAILRGGITFQPARNFNLYLSSEYQWFDPQQVPQRNVTPNSGHDVTGAPFRLCPVFNICQNLVGQPRTSMQQFVEHPRNREWRNVANADLNLGPARIVSITGYHTLDILNQNDIDASPLPILEAFDQVFHIKEFSQEVRLQSVENGSLSIGNRLAWQIGGVYNHSNAFMAQPLKTLRAPGATPVVTNQTQRVVRDGKAVFAHVDLTPIQQLTISAGIRRSWDDYRHDFSCAAPIVPPPPAAPTISCRRPASSPTGYPFPHEDFTQSRQDTNTSVEGGATFHFDSTKLIYVRYAEGYRGGGFVGFPATLAAADLFPAPPANGPGGFGPETSRSYEAGIKTEWFNRKLLFNATVFQTTFDNLQRSQVETVNLNGIVTFVNVVRNVAKARMTGFELESFLHPAPGFDIRASVGYTEPKYLDYTVGGVDHTHDPFPFVQKWTASVMPSYEKKFGDAFFDTFRVSGKWEFRSGSYLNSLADPTIYQPAYSTFDAEVQLQGGRNSRYTITAYVNNIANNPYLVYGSIVAGAAFAIDQPGRTWGISASVNF